MSKKLKMMSVIGASIVLVVIASLATGGRFQAVFGGPDLWSLEAGIKSHAASSFIDVNKKLLTDYDIDFKKAGHGNETCYSSTDPLDGPLDSCGRYLRAEPVTADDAFITKWRNTSPVFEAWLLDNGWHKEWNAAQPIAEILDKPQNDGSIGVNYSKRYGKVSCRLSLMWVQPNEPNQLNASEECFGSLNN